jgi:hypothetical protein
MAENLTIQKEPILITGCPRSGASMIAGVLKICGAFSGNCAVSPEDPYRWMYENVNMCKLEEHYLASIGADFTGQRDFPVTKELQIPLTWNAEMNRIILRDGYESGEWMYKSRRIALLWPIWQYAYPNAKWIIVRRRTGDIVHSCMNTDFMNAYSTREDWIEMVHQYEERFIEIISEGLNVRVVWPHRMAEGNYQQLFELLDWLGLEWKTDVLNFIDPMFWKLRKKGN